MARRFSMSSERRTFWRRGGITRLCAGSFSAGETIAASRGCVMPPLSISARKFQMLASIVLVEIQRELLTFVVSSPAVNNLRTKRSRSTDTGRMNWTAKNCPVCRTTVPATKPTSEMKTRTGSPWCADIALSLAASRLTPESDMFSTRPADMVPLGPNIQIGSSSSNRGSLRRAGVSNDIMQTSDRTMMLMTDQNATIGSTSAF